MREQLETLVAECIREHLDSTGAAPATLVTTDAVLLGRGGILDSIGLVTVIVSIEQRIEDEFGRHVTLADERAFSQRSSPFRTVGSLADYAAGLLAAGD